LGIYCFITKNIKLDKKENKCKIIGRGNFMKIVIFFVFFISLISCSDNKKIEKINDVMWIEHIDTSVLTQDQGEEIMKFVNFEINGIKYTVFLLFEQNYSKEEPVVIDIRGEYVNNNKKLFSMRLENYFERYFQNTIIHKDMEYLTLFDKENNTLKYKLLAKDEEVYFPELTDWIIENMFKKNDKE
jgi:hypothetical protein